MHEKDLTFTCCFLLGDLAMLLQRQLVRRDSRRSVVRYCNSGCDDRCGGIYYFDEYDLRLSALRSRIQAEMVSAFGLCSHKPRKTCQMSEVRKYKLLQKEKT